MKKHLEYIDVALAGGEHYKLPYIKIDSGVKGPCVLITAAMHGNELQGSEALCRVLPMIENELVSGTCIAVPFANPAAIRKHQPHIDYEIQKVYGRDKQNNLNCSWPGKKDGTSAERLSYAMANAIVHESTHLLDLHCWNHVMAAAALVKKGDMLGEKLAASMGLRLARRCDCCEEPPHTLADLFFVSGRPSVTIEFSGQYGFWKTELDLAEKAVLGYLRALDMLGSAGSSPRKPLIWMDEAETVEITAPCDGVFVPEDLSFYQPVAKGAKLGTVRDIESFDEFPICAPVAGLLTSFNPMQRDEWENSRTFNHPFVTRGQFVASMVKECVSSLFAKCSTKRLKQFNL